MKMVKSLLLGIAAGLVAMSGAQAADLPLKAKPVHEAKSAQYAYAQLKPTIGPQVAEIVWFSPHNHPS